MLEKVNNEEIDSKSIFFSDEAWFHQHGHLASQFNQLTSVNTPPPARLAWSQTHSFQPAGLEENFRDRNSQTYCITVYRSDLRTIDLRVFNEPLSL